MKLVERVEALEKDVAKLKTIVKDEKDVKEYDEFEYNMVRKIMQKNGSMTVNEAFEYVHNNLAKLLEENKK